MSLVCTRNYKPVVYSENLINLVRHSMGDVHIFNIKACGIYSNQSVSKSKGCSIAQAVISQFPTARCSGSSQGKVMWDLWYTKWHWCAFSPSALVSFLNH
jgi:hypothetical protein